jgi:RNA polymerase sigma-B factor
VSGTRIGQHLPVTPHTATSLPSRVRETVDAEELFRRVRFEQDRSAREELVRRYAPLARKLALRYIRTSEPLDDLVQVATIGLLNAVDRFDPSRGPSFSSFAIPTILGELKRHFRDRCWSVHVPRGEQELSLRVQRAEQQLSSRLGRSPTVQQLAELLEISTEQVCEGLQVTASYQSTSLDAPVGRIDEDPRVLGETLGELDGHYEFVEDAVSVTSVLGRMPDRDRELLGMRYREELTQREIADRIGVSQMQVSRLLRRALTRADELVQEQ